ncbi:DUF1822 family protein [Scytonema sp. NUACC26]|uniref:DUF1822 family protein n=1 Tax=Scytonema sp. NUACC26 TaxID=3140176 RepID=UPI0034DB7F03
MTFNSTKAFADITQLYLEIPQTVQVRACEHSQSFSTLSRRWNAYLNQICLSTFLPWLREEHIPSATPWSNAATSASIWEVVNGTAIVFGTTRMVLIPTEAIDLSELRVPQEWVDIPTWAADYYLATQVNPEEGWIKIAGYATHEKLKTKGSYDVRDRTYSLDKEDLIPDLNILWVTRQLCPTETTRSVVTPLQSLTLVQADNLIQRLGNTTVILPRLAVPFTIWGALLEHGGWRQRLYERRQSLPEQWSVLNWIVNGISDLAQQAGWVQMEPQSSLAGGRGVQEQLKPVLIKRLDIAGQQYELRVLPQGKPEEQRWRFELRNVALGKQIPAGFKLRLLTEDLQPFENNEDRAITPVDLLYIEVAFNEPAEGLVWEVEPLPKNYQREILRF